jgi:hypothetical protein
MILNKVKVIVIFIILFFSTTGVSVAGDVMQEGTVLQEDSYVFTIDEATDLLRRVEVLEQKELLLAEYQALNEVQARQIDLYKINYDILNQQIIQYSSLVDLNENMLNKSMRRNNFAELKNWGIFTLGVAVTVGAFLAADKIGDTMERTY